MLSEREIEWGLHPKNEERQTIADVASLVRVMICYIVLTVGDIKTQTDLTNQGYAILARLGASK